MLSERYPHLSATLEKLITRRIQQLEQARRDVQQEGQLIAYREVLVLAHTTPKEEG